MTESDAAEALKVANELHDVVGKILEGLETTATYARRSRLVALLSAGVAVLALLLGGAVVYGLYEIHQNQLRSCAIGNDLRAGQLRVWDEVLSLSSASPPPHETPAEQKSRLKETSQFKAYIATQFRQVDCSKLYPGYLPK